MALPDREELLQTLDEVACFAEKQGFETLARELREDRLPQVRDGRLSMVVLGEFNHGKSTVINALIGEALLPTGITPTTSVITHLTAGEGDARMVFEDRVETLAPEKLRDAIVRQAADGLRHVEIPSRSPLLVDGLTIVDTPGVNDISRQKVEITYGYVPKADVIIYVLDATQAMKRSEITFIRERLLQDTHERIFFVLGKADMLEEDELKDVLAHVRSELEDLVGNRPVWPISARRALDGPEPSFDAFREALVAWLQKRRSQVVLRGGLRAGLRTTGLVTQNLALKRGALDLTDAELAQRVAAVRQRLSRSRAMVSDQVALIERRTGEISASAREDLHTFIEAFCSQLPGELAKATVSDLRLYLGDFIHHSFQRFLESEADHIGVQLERLAEEVIAITNRNMRQTVQGVEEKMGTRNLTLSLDGRSFGYDVSILAVGMLGAGMLAVKNMLTGGILTVAAPLLAIALKPKIDARIREDATEQSLKAIREAGATVRTEMERVIDAFAEDLRRFVEDAGDRLYRQIAEALDAITRERREAGADSAPLLASVDTALKEAEALRARFAGWLEEAPGWQEPVDAVDPLAESPAEAVEGASVGPPL